MTRLLVALCAGAALVGPALAQEPLRLPTDMPPTFGLVTAVDRDKGEVTVANLIRKEVPRSEVRTVTVEGVQKQKVVTAYVVEMVQVNVPVSVKKVSVSTAAGTKLTEADALDRLTPGTTVLLGYGGRMVDAAYLRILRPDALVLVLPADGVVGPPVPLFPNPGPGGTKKTSP